MQKLTMILLTFAIPIAFAQTACSDSDMKTRRSAGAQAAGNNNNGNGNDAAEEPGEDPGEGEEPGEQPTPDGGVTTDTGGGGVEDSGTTPPPADSGTTPPPPTDTGTTPPPPTPQTYDVEVDNNYFEPSMLTIKVGDTVRWEWEASGHTVTSGASCTANGTFDSGLRNDGATYSHTFTAPGTYPYHCVPHCGMGMTGTVVVTE